MKIGMNKKIIDGTTKNTVIVSPFWPILSATNGKNNHKSNFVM